ncbi:16S rRNA (guanine(966)-N(2))-methyltransferase RsmD [Listeria innocua]|uniref:16S rRNA (guanine(966)-N(2))-methyltransferase RsmD n=1 Tax=Listeria TaxID=1637 RepID=UPI000F28E6CA|nr:MULTISPECIES: 16S rRNA (guanine(966)-N(2))-methyltransferase RsmD [Listeria]EAD5867730.1 16S rRNA (guanine(966)-N(2))-methyltransferase RsmD [Listeria innocua]EAF5674225.1 16S rRNA (guanine(966)-N(2))-methyltransferase RsmD [Listeria innocua]EDO1174363.1 16S rRNA (guanine(966)-N(2))-methyltransferase RsmD [Listeria innocua]EHF3601864.1 16S rRNA (guanine(966)-N(2))-methyltransferase RsmD [Listeria innocua]EHF3616342.1 16S rRNA (guanine(966)-N(2))-methyltransferase RsmD [Listeria innocua]
MRVIAGERKGHALKAVPGNNTRPTTDKVKESLFSIIGPFFDGDIVLDLFAGSGGLGIEALSRGAERAVFIDQATLAIKTIRQNIEGCHFTERAEVYRNDAERALKLLHKNEWKFDLVFLDPPYKKQQLEKLLIALEKLELVSENGRIVCEHDKEAVMPDKIGKFEKIKSVSYGITVLSIFEFQEA